MKPLRKGRREEGEKEEMMRRWKGRERSEGKEGRRKKTHGKEKEIDERERKGRWKGRWEGGLLRTE